ncbi:hypothetical protein SprV_0401712700 [Sparganum proliferum]
MDQHSLVTEHCAASGHTFAFQNAQILGRGTNQTAMETLETWHTLPTSINRCTIHPAAYETLRVRLNQRNRRQEVRNTNESEQSSRPNTDEGCRQAECDHRFNWDGTEVVAMANTKPAREFLEAWYSNAGSINRHVDLDAHYEGLRSRLTAPCPNATSTAATPATRSTIDPPSTLPLQHRDP